MRIYIGADHAGFNLKEKLKATLQSAGHEIVDKGAFQNDPADDYPDFMVPVAQAISQDPERSRGIIIGGSGQGEAMVANRFPHVRAAVYYSPNFDILDLSRSHNNANILSLAARFLSDEEAVEAVLRWLAAEFSGEQRHTRRLHEIDSVTKDVCEKYYQL
ncbi:MAG: RpiB/LacA/LacB family sugar-phosphate isomerase [Candidatus Vogelbacteria bacterium]|nr:RpiB/LacA/LacB family sugar-phosphate isomerase [Candidatus Vogelbacteria bacterium]